MHIGVAVRHELVTRGNRQQLEKKLLYVLPNFQLAGYRASKRKSDSFADWTKWLSYKIYENWTKPIGEIVEAKMERKSADNTKE